MSLQQYPPQSRRDDRCITVCKRSAAYGSKDNNPQSRRNETCITVCKRSAAYGSKDNNPQPRRGDTINHRKLQ
jgi:hypothetical protein